jgi:hypothetical protein
MGMTNMRGGEDASKINEVSFDSVCVRRDIDACVASFCFPDSTGCDLILNNGQECQDERLGVTRGRSVH